MSGDIAPKCLSVPVEAGVSTTSCRKRQKRGCDGDREAENKGLQGDMFTDATAGAAKSIIAALQQAACVPPLLRKGATVDERTVACALGLYFGQTFNSDRAAKVRYGVGETTDVKGLWVNGKLAKLKEQNLAVLNSIESVFTGGVEPAQSAPYPPSSDEEGDAQQVEETRLCDAVPGDDLPGGEDGVGDEGAESDEAFGSSLEDHIELVRAECAAYESQAHLPLRSNAARWYVSPRFTPRFLPHIHVFPAGVTPWPPRIFRVLLLASSASRGR